MSIFILRLFKCATTLALFLHSSSNEPLAGQVEVEDCIYPDTTGKFILSSL